MSTDVGAAVEAGRTSAHPRDLEPGKFWVMATAQGFQQFDLTGDKYRDSPQRIAQSVALSHVDSLLDYWDKHADESSDAYADRDKHTITAVLDAHHKADAEARARWQSHKAVLTLAYSDPLTAWLSKNDRIETQLAFAEFVEDWMTYIVEPDAADLVEMAQLFQATTTATFKSGHKLVNGQRQLEYSEQIDASVKGDQLAVPTSLKLRMPIWRGAADSTELTARIRYRINHNGVGKLGVGYKLDRPTEIIDAAFEGEVARVEDHIGRKVLRGQAAGQ